MRRPASGLDRPGGSLARRGDARTRSTHRPGRPRSRPRRPGHAAFTRLRPPRPGPGQPPRRPGRRRHPHRTPARAAASRLRSPPGPAAAGPTRHTAGARRHRPRTWRRAARPPPPSRPPRRPPPAGRRTRRAAKGSNTGLPLPRFAALRTDEVNLRTGPGTRYPIDWVYKRRDLPVQIEREFEVWRLVADQDGVKGWVHQATLTGRRSFVRQGRRARPAARARATTPAAVARLKPGVIGRLRACEAGAPWCQVQVGDYRGWLKRDEFWGILPARRCNDRCRRPLAAARTAERPAPRAPRHGRRAASSCASRSTPSRMP